MFEQTLSPEEEAVRCKQLEKGWNNKISITKESRRSITMSEDIRDFINATQTPNSGSMGSPGAGAFGKSFKDSPPHKGKNTTGKLGMSMSMSMEPKAKNAFETIASTFGFVHHAGTDQNLELKIIKQIVARESQLMKLTHLCEQKSVTNEHGEKVLKPLAGTKILQLLIALRDTTLDYLDFLQVWRASAISEGLEEKDAEENPKVFVWEGYNYTMKIVSDMDFLSDSASLIEALGITADKLRANPLMLPTTLEETADSWMDPALRASYDCNNQTSGAAYEERLRLRNAERCLLLEIECNAEISTEGMLAQRGVGGKGANDSVNNNDRAYDPALLTWQQEAKAQMDELNPAQADYHAVNAMRPKSQQGGNGISRSPNENKSPGKQNAQKSKGAWNAQAEIFPESNGLDAPGLDSGVAFYENFGGDLLQQGEQRIPMEEMNQYDSYLTGNNVLDMEPNQQGTYADQFGFVDGTGAEANNDYFGGFQGGDEEFSISAATSLTIDNITAFDLEVIISVQSPPNHIMLAGAACVILLSLGNDPPADVTWEAFRKLVAAENPAQKMNTIEPALIPKFKVRSIKPYVDQLEQVSGGDNLPENTLESFERLGRWVRQVVHAADFSKKRKQKKSDVEPKMLTGTTVEDGRHDLLFDESKMLLMGGKPLKDDKGRQITKAQSQRHRAEMLMKGMTVGRKVPAKESVADGPNGEKQNPSIKPSELWPVHTEILETVYKHPLLLTVLSSQQEVSSNNEAAAKKMRKAMMQYDPLELAGNPNDPPPERIVVKVYNLVDSQETAININVREFTIFLYDLIDRYTVAAADFFRPASLLWWVENLRHIISVSARVNSKLILLVSKASIEKLVKKGLGQDNSESIGRDSMTLQSMPDSNMDNNSVARDWDFYGDDGDFMQEQEQQDPSRQVYSGSKKSSRQEMRQDFSENNPNPGNNNANQMQGAKGRKQTPGVAPSSSSAGSKPPSRSNPASSSSSRNKSNNNDGNNKGSSSGNNSRQNQHQQQQHAEIMALDYGEDVFEDDGDGEFEAEVARATQMSRTISREKPSSAPGSLSAPQSMSSVPSRHASDADMMMGAQGTGTGTGTGTAGSNNIDNLGVDEAEYLSDEVAIANQSKGGSIGTDEDVPGSVGGWEALGDDNEYNDDFNSNIGSSIEEVPSTH